MRVRSADSAKSNKVYTPLSTAGPRTVPVHCWSEPAGLAVKALPWGMWVLQLPWEAILQRVARGILQKYEGRASMKGAKTAFRALKSNKSLKTCTRVPTKSRYCPVALLFPGSMIEISTSKNCHLFIHYALFSLEYCVILDTQYC